MSRPSKWEQALYSGERVTGIFWPAGTDHDAAGVLAWSKEGGAHLELIGDTDGWPADLRGATFDVHGAPSDTSGHHLTLLDWRSSRWPSAGGCAWS